MKTPLVSIIIPCYNSEKYIEECINSVLVQTYKNLEVIVVDDCSTDSSYELVNEKFCEDDRVVLLRNNINSGVNKTRHFGVSKSYGEYICFLDSDDLFLPEKVEKQLQLFERNPEVVLSHTGVEFIGTYDNKIIPSFNKLGKSKIYDLKRESYYLKENYICASSVMLDKKAFDGIDFDKKQLFQYEDFVLWTVLSTRGLYSYLEDKLTKYTCHTNSATQKVLSNVLVREYSDLEYCLNCLSYRDLGLYSKVKILKRIFMILKNLVNNYKS